MRIQANFWYGRESSSLNGSENVDEEEDDDFGVEKLEFDMANSG